MASRQVQLFATAVAVVAVACLPALQAAAVEWTVGDDGGWRPRFNETFWSDAKDFRVGDTLLFKYAMGQHTVVEVHNVDFRHCNRLGAWSSGNDVVALDKPGWRWFICDKPNHCSQGMKMAINILENARTPAPTTPPPPPPQSSVPVVGYTTGGAVAAAAAVVAASLAF